jgi:hypothetical protein
VEALKARKQGGHAHADERAQEEEAVRAELAKLNPKDRALAEVQGFCAAHPTSRLGSMGKPYRMEIEGRPVFLCCDGCAEAAREDPGRTLATVERLKAQGRKQKAR